MDPNEVISEHQNVLVAIAKANGVVCLSQYNECTIAGKNPLEFLGLAGKTRQRLKSSGSVEWDWITEDILGNASSDIAFSLKNMHLYRPGINDYTNLTAIQGGSLPLEKQSISDKRYLYFAGVGLEKVYAYWARIGDLLNLAFNLKLKGMSLTFIEVIKKLDKNGISSIHLQWLKDFVASDYASLSSKRKMVVHTKGLDSYFRKCYLEGGHKKGLQYWVDLQAEKEGLISFISDQLKLTIKGFEETVLLIAEKAD